MSALQAWHGSRSTGQMYCERSTECSLQLEHLSQQMAVKQVRNAAALLLMCSFYLCMCGLQSWRVCCCRLAAVQTEDESIQNH